MRRPRRRMSGNFCISVAFAAGFMIRDLMENKSVIRDGIKKLWVQTLDLFTPAVDPTGNTGHTGGSNDLSGNDKDTAPNSDATDSSPRPDRAVPDDSPDDKSPN